MRNTFTLPAGIALTLTAAMTSAARADIPGTYSETQSVDGGKIRYTLTLENDGDAELISERQDSPRLNDSNIRDYGTILEALDRDRKARHVGRWTRDGDSRDGFRLALSRFYHGSADSYEFMSARGSVKDNYVALNDWSKHLYGRRTNFSFFARDRKLHSDDVAKGVGILALGAIIASAVSHHDHRDKDRNDSDSKDFGELRTESRGSGSYVTDNDSIDIRHIDVNLRRNGDARIVVRLRNDEFVVEGDWRHAGRNRVHINLNRADSRRVRGSGTLNLRNERLESVDFSYYDEYEANSYRINFASNR